MIVLMLRYFLALMATSLLTGLFIFQLLLTSGYRLGRYAWGGHYTVLPTTLRIASLFTAISYLIMAGVLLAKAGLLGGFNYNVLSFFVWLMAVLFAASAVLNGTSHSRQERTIMMPISIVLALCCLGIALNV